MTERGGGNGRKREREKERGCDLCGILKKLDFKKNSEK